MNYFVPAWHKQLIDWSYSTPTLEFDDAVSHLRILQDNAQPVGLVLTDYQPQLTTKLNQLALFPNTVWSAFDYLQGIETLDSQVVDIRDLKWPADALFDFTNFRIFVVAGGQHYATIVLDTQGKILQVNYVAGDNAGSTLLFDSRGFVSRQSQGQVDTYFDPSGNWRFKHDRHSDRVTVNQELVQTAHGEYAHLGALLEEVVTEHFLPRIKKNDQLVVTVDDAATINLSQTFCHQRPIYSASRWAPYDQVIAHLAGERLIVDSDKTASRVKQFVTPGQLATLPLFQSQFKLGHSQRLAEQRVAVFAEHMTDQELMAVLDQLYPRLMKDPGATALYLFSYSNDQAGMVSRVFAHFRKKHDGEFILSVDEIDPGENQLEEDELPPLLKIKQQRLVSNADVLTALDKIRLLILWGQPDEFMSMAAVSVGIPILQNVASSELEDHHNGLLCHNWDQLANGVSYYLDHLKNWNTSLVYNVQLLNKYSEANLLKRWQEYLEGDENG
ncbi:accessory Sec system protein Asp1 [uncultured Limosilactobacillus sp.]|uniref:accessory Sec system protein Asp1 n=1 Tax=uncultured Limosilactobacillus sp. TaxID=2837629 RepID=UPI0025FE91A2|nr:accessory Sec system protein Asp1 [uncultured Limosilactobacillus sp.]